MGRILCPAPGVPNNGPASAAYSALCHSLASVGQQRAPLFLSMVCLSLISRLNHADDVLAVIAGAQAQCEDAAEGG